MKFREKTEDELHEQLIDTEAIFDVDLAPKNWKGINKYELKDSHKVRYEQYLKLLREQKQGVSEHDIDEKIRVLISGLNNLELYIQEHVDGEKKELRGERQVSVFKDLQSFLEQGETEGYVKLPTGVGKTILFLKLIEALGLKTLVLVPSLVLIGQSGERTKEYTGLEYSEASSLSKKDYSKPLVFGTYQSLATDIESGKCDPSEFPLLILDEAHRSLSSARMGAIKKFKGIKIGFTATPNYANNKKLEELLETEIHSMDLSEAIEEGLLCETQTIHVHTMVDMSSVKITNKGECDEKELEKVLNVESRNKAAVDFYKDAFSGQKAVCYCSGVTHAKNLEALFKERGVTSASITGETSKEERDIILEKFASGEIMVLTNAEVLIEGFDEPTCSVVLNLRPTFSIVSAEQRGGRGLRLDKNNPRKVGYVIDFIDKNLKRPPVLFSEILGGSSRVPEKVTKLETSDPEVGETKDFHNIKIDGLVVVTDPEVVLTLSQNNKEMREKNEPSLRKEGWASVDMLATEFANLQVTSNTVKGILKKIKIPEGGDEKQLDPETGKVATYYSPSVVEECKKQIRVLKSKLIARIEEIEMYKIQKEKLALLTIDKITDDKKFEPRSYSEFDYRKVDIKAAIKGWVESYVEKNPQLVRVVTIQGRDYADYSPAVMDMVIQRFVEEFGISEYRFGKNQYNKLGYKLEKSFLSELALQLTKESSVIALKKKYHELKMMPDIVFPVFGNVDKRETYVPPSIVETLEKYTNELARVE